jgi:hypothetical protein
MADNVCPQCQKTMQRVEEVYALPLAMDRTSALNYPARLQLY